MSVRSKGSVKSTGSKKLTSSSAPVPEIAWPGTPNLEAAAFLDPDHVLMQRVQAALTKQLTNLRDKIVVEVREKDETLRKLVKQREDFGVELYNIQQELVKLQSSVTAAQTDYTVTQHSRQEAEQVLGQVKAVYNDLQQDLEQQKLKYPQSFTQKQLDKKNQTMSQIDKHYQDLQSQIQVSQRETFKTEEEMSRMEKAKMDQDFLIDRLNEQIKELEEKIALSSAQLDAQKRETSLAAKTLSDAAAEMDGISLEKKHLLQTWKSCLIDIQQKDETLGNTEAATLKLREESEAMDGEIANYKKAIQNEQSKNETFTGTINKVNAEVTFLGKQIQRNVEKKEALVAEIDQKQKALEQTEAELQTVIQQSRGLEDKVNSIQREGDIIVNQTVQLEDQISENLQLQKTLEKGASSAEQGAQRLGTNVREKEIQIGQLQNELARIRLDFQNTRGQNTKLKENLFEITAGLKDKDQLIERYEIEIRRRNDEIERKQTEVDRLNKKYDQLVSGIKDENMGPLEATIHNLTNEISKKARECSDLQYYWLRSQTELVNFNKELEKQADEISGMEGMLTVSYQKQLRIQSNFESTEREIKELTNIINTLQLDMQKLSTLISKNNKMQASLSEGNVGLENEFYSQLKEAEAEAINLESRIDAVKQEKEAVLHDVVEAERLTMLWEKKIQLARETADTLNPNIGAAETKALSKEVQRMETELSVMKKEQEHLILEMQRAVDRREGVLVRTKDMGKKAVVAKTMEEKRAKDLRSRVKEAHEEIAAAKQMIKAIKGQKEEIRQKLLTALQQADNFKRQELDLKLQVDTRSFKKQRLFDFLTVYQRIVKKYENIERETDLEAKAVTITKEMVKQKEKMYKIEEVINKIRLDFPNYSEDLEKIKPTSLIQV